MLELSESSTPTPFDPRTVDERTDAELDGLPFGVIALDEDGTVLRYNLYESRLARLDRNQVVGRSFFGEIAPCTRAEIFQRHFRAAVASNDPARVERFEFVFDFKFGAQDVVIEVVRAASAPRFYLLVNRRRIEAPRPVPVETLAIEQARLAPGEALHGVRRDNLQRRFVDAPAPFFAALRATCDRLAPETWQLFATEWGLQWGRRAAVDLEASALEQGGQSLRELPMREVAGLVSAYFADRGWGSPSFDFAAMAEGVLVVELERSALAEAAPRSARRDGAQRTDLTCHLMAGCLSGVLSAVAGRRLAGREVACAAADAPRCAIVIVAHERRGTIDTTLATGARGVSPVRAALRRAPRASESSR